MYGSNPFYMGKATDKSWFGVYHNLAAASDWWISNDEASKKVYVETYAAGGVGDIFIIFGDTPNYVVEQYHHIIGKPVLTPQWALGWH